MNRWNNSSQINDRSPNEHKDNDISLILDYAFRRFYGANTNLFLLACAGKTKEQIMPEVQKLLEHTQYNNYLEDTNETL